MSKELMQEEVIKRLKDKGVVTTSQRIEVLDLIKGSREHPTAEDIYNAVRERFPTISLATIYNILDKLVEVGEVRQLSIRRDKACYDGETHTHHHFYCKRCHAIANIEIHCPTANAHEVNGHKIDELQAYFYGTCKNCLGAA